jgi:Uma2 family endonuclease
VTNPRVVLEVTSDSSEDYDRGSKLQQYQTIPSLEAIVVVSHRERKIEVWSRTRTTWSHAVYGSGQRAELEPVHAALDVDALYAAATEPEG